MMRPLCGSFLNHKATMAMIAAHKKNKPFVSCMKSGNFTGVLSYNLLFNPTYKAAFETDWRYILSQGDLRIMHALKLRTREAEREVEDDRLAEVQSLTSAG